MTETTNIMNNGRHRPHYYHGNRFRNNFVPRTEWLLIEKWFYLLLLADDRALIKSENHLMILFFYLSRAIAQRELKSTTWIVRTHGPYSETVADVLHYIRAQKLIGVKMVPREGSTVRQAAFFIDEEQKAFPIAQLWHSKTHKNVLRYLDQVKRRLNVDDWMFIREYLMDRFPSFFFTVY